MRRKLAGLAVSAAVLLNTVSLFAHHSFTAEFDDKKPMTIKGTLTKVEMTNPHGWLYLNVKDKNGKFNFDDLLQAKDGKPGVSLVDLGVLEVTGFQSRLWSFTVTNGLLLDAFNTYWVGVGNVSPDALSGLNVDVVQGGNFTFTGQPLTMMPFSGASGISSGMNAPIFGSAFPGGALPFQADGTGGAVPEPGSFGLLAIGVAGLFVGNRWKSRSVRQAPIRKAQSFVISVATQTSR